MAKKIGTPAMAPSKKRQLFIHVISPSDMFVSVVFNEKSVDAVVDSGAPVSVISADLVRGQNFHPTTHAIRAVNGNPLQVAGSTQVQFWIRDTKYVHECVVSPSMHNKFLLGADFLKDHGFVADFGKGILSNVHGSVSLGDRVCHAVSVAAGDQTRRVEHHITLEENARPVFCRPFRTPVHLQEIVKEQLLDMIKSGVVVPSQSSWSAPVVLVKKKNGKYRFCVDFRRLNALTKVDKYPIPLVDDLLDALSGQTVFSTLDLKNGFWQVPMAAEDREKTAFSVQGMGHFQFVVMPFGLCNAPSTFQRLMHTVLSDVPGCLVYQDDIIVSGATKDEHDLRLKAVLAKLKEANLILNLEKCVFRKESVEFLGHVVGAAGVAPNGEKVKAILEIATPTSVAQVRTFLGMAGYYRRFIPNFSQMAEPLLCLTKKEATFTWTRLQEEAFTSIKSAIASGNVLQFPHPNWRFVVATDASNVGIGATLCQEDEKGDYHTIAFASRTLNGAERNLATIEKECLAIIWVVSKWRHYLLGRSFRILCDHKPLQWLKSVGDSNQKLTRWALKLSEFDYEVVHVSGTANVVPDALSRLPIQVNNLEFSSELSQEQLANLQAADEELSQLLYRKRHPTAAGGSSGFRGSAGRWTQIWRQIILLDGVLYRCLENGTRVLLVPRILREKLLRSWHERGHFGVQALTESMQERYYWPAMVQDIQSFVADCIHCNCRKSQGVPDRPPMKKMISLGPSECWAMDVVGPLPITTQGNRYILTMYDLFTRWPEAVAIPDQTAETVAKAIIERIVAVHGVPLKILTDQGRNFECELIRELCKLLGIGKICTSAYHPQTNGACEKFNGSLCNILSAMVNRDANDWDAALPLALAAYRVKTHSTTGFSPFKLLFGRDPKCIPDNITQSALWDGGGMEKISFLDTLMRRLQALHRQVKDKQIEETAHLDGSAVDSKPLLAGQKVFLRKAVRKHKFDGRYAGPFEVVRDVNEQNAVINLGTEQYTTHKARLKRLPSGAKQSGDTTAPATLDPLPQPARRYPCRNRQHPIRFQDGNWNQHRARVFRPTVREGVL